MSYCPSKDWDRYCDMMEQDDTICAQCEKELPDKLDQDTETPEYWEAWDEGFCSPECYRAFTKAEDELWERRRGG